MLAAARDVVRYLFRRLSPDASEALTASIAGLGLERHAGVTAAVAAAPGTAGAGSNAPGPKAAAGDGAAG